VAAFLVATAFWSLNLGATGLMTYDQISDLIESQSSIEHMEDPNGVSAFPVIRRMQLALVLGNERDYFDNLSNLVSRETSERDLASVHLRQALSRSFAFRVELDDSPLTEDELRLFALSVNQDVEPSDMLGTLDYAAYLYSVGDVNRLRVLGDALKLTPDAEPKGVSSEQLRILVCAQVSLWEARLTGDAAKISKSISCVEMNPSDKLRVRRLEFLRSAKDLVLARTQLVLAEAYMMESDRLRDKNQKAEYLNYGLLALDTVRAYIDSFDHPGLWKKRLGLLVDLFDKKISIVAATNSVEAARLSKLRDLAYAQSL
jgi:hypothetical protein